jgi:hypothetical protein
MSVSITKARKPRYHHHAVTTVTQARSAIFAPTLRPTMDKAVVVVETPWAKATISRVQLTQVHRDILDVLFTHCNPQVRADGSCAFVFHPHALLKHMHETGNNVAWLREKLDNLKDAGLEVVWPKYTVRTSILRKHAWTKDESQYAVVLESEYMQFFVKDVRVHSDGLTDAILSLEHAPTKALVRFVISHKSWNRSVEDTLDAIGYVGGERSRRRAKEKIASEGDALLREFGIAVTGGAVRYKKHGKVWFERPVRGADASQ